MVGTMVYQLVITFAKPLDSGPPVKLTVWGAVPWAIFDEGVSRPSLKIPTIGIGASKHCDGQILVTDDMLGLSGFYPKFVKKYVNLNRIIEKAVKKYTRDVKLRKFPSEKNFLNGSKHK